jgi:pimeloyl-ACP methyl ester carboxylesterase
MLKYYQEYRFATADRFELTLFRSPAKVPSAFGESRPVLLLPGANSNRYGFGLLTAASLACCLNAAGRDVWALDFRGTQSSRYLGTGRPPISLDRKIEFDVPNAVDHLLTVTGAERVDMVGHSLGGILTYFYCGGPDGERVGRAVTLAAPASFRSFFGSASAVMRPPARLLAPVAQRLPGLGIHRLARLRGPIGHLYAMLHHVRPGTMTARERRLWLDHGVEDMAGGDLAQLMRWVGEGRLCAMDGMDYGHRLEKVATPTLVICVAGDRFVDNEAVTEAYERLSAQEKSFVTIGKENGASRNYAHQDVLLSRHAADDVYPHVLDWLCRPVDGRAERPVFEQVAHEAATTA